MSLIEVQARYGTGALVRLLAALAGFLLLRTLRAPLVLAARLLEVAASRMDALATGHTGPGVDSRTDATAAPAA